MKQTVSDRMDNGLAASDVVAGRLREEIISGIIVSGTSLVETDIAAQYGASRNTVREAMRQLRSENLVIYIRHRGNIVKTLTPADVYDIYRVRRVLELSAIEQSAFAGDDLLAAIHNVIRSAEQAQAERQWRDVGTWSLRVHPDVGALLGSESLDAFCSGIVAQLRLVFALADDERAFQNPWVEGDRRIHEILMCGQRDRAADAMKLYLEDSEAGVLDLVRAARIRHK